MESADSLFRHSIRCATFPKGEGYGDFTDTVRTKTFPLGGRCRRRRRKREMALCSDVGQNRDKNGTNLGQKWDEIYRSLCYTGSVKDLSLPHPPCPFREAIKRTLDTAAPLCYSHREEM